MMADLLGRISISKGPSREELFDALRLTGERRKVIFVVRDDGNNLIPLECGISMLKPEDGSGLRWLVEMFSYYNHKTVTGNGYYDTVNRQGYINL